MSTVRKTITLTELQDQWIKAQIAAGHFTNDSEYIRDLIRRDHERRAQFEALRAAVQEGLDSGPSEKTVPTIMEEVEARLRSDERL
jgi:antitoxin ParD1/3/4